jgi:hypothetical protein
MNHGGGIQQGGTIGLGKGHLNVSPRPLTANRCNANGSVTSLCAQITARTGGGAAENFLAVVMSTREASSQVLATHGVNDIAALDVTTKKPSGGGNMWVAASSAKVEVATVDEVAV